MIQHQEVILNQDSSMAVTGSDNNTQNKRAADRRFFSIKAIRYSVSTGRRKASRRQINNSTECIVDNHEGWLLPMMLGVIVLCVSDAYMTILLMNNGAIEANPVMAILIDNGPNLFFWVKFISTSLGMMVLLTLKNFTIFNYISGYHLIVLALSGYAWLLGYEIILLDSML